MKPCIGLFFSKPVLHLAAVLLLMGGCTAFQPAIQTRTMTPGEYIAVKRGDILTRGELSTTTRETLSITGLADGSCASPSRACIEALKGGAGLSEEQRQSALAELWVAYAQTLPSSDPAAEAGNPQFDAWMEAARHGYAYLFFTERSASIRAFEDRQIQVRDYYNLATQEVSRLLFEIVKGTERTTDEESFRWGRWSIRVDMAAVRLPGGVGRPKELVPASSVSFAGLRSIYRRDGFGAELLAVTAEAPGTAGARGQGPQPEAAGAQPPFRWGLGNWSEMNFPVVNVLARFPGGDLKQVLATREVVLTVRDPYRDASAAIQGHQVPLAANFTAGYGLWLARSGFTRQSLRTLFGHSDGLDRPHLYLMQPFDPDRRIIVMLHGLASSPEAWANVANELMGDEALRRHYQIWQFYYPTNVPIALNHYAIRQTLRAALDYFDAGRATTASQGMVLIGHSMGGVIARLMVSPSGDAIEKMARIDHNLDDEAFARLMPSLGPVISFAPVPNVGRAVFVAAPHRGTEVAGGWLPRWLASFVRLPGDLTQGIAQQLQASRRDRSPRPKDLPNSVQNLDKNDPFIQAAADLPISPEVRYHSIIARRDASVPLALSDDGFVPYWSSHLPGAASEAVITSSHSVQEGAMSIIELRGILREDIRQYHGVPCTAAAARVGG